MSARLAKLGNMTGSNPAFAASPSALSHTTKPSSPVDSDSSDDEGLYFVEQIVDRRQNPASRTVEYLCKFEDWSDSAKTWVSFDTLKASCMDLIEAFSKGVEIKTVAKTGKHAHAIRLFTAR